MSSFNPAETPALMPPPGVIPNFVDPPSQAQWVIITVCLCLSLTTILIAIRIFSRVYISGPLAWDDCTSILAWLGLFGWSAIQIVDIKYGSMVDEWNVSIAHIVPWARLAVDEEILYGVLIFITKLSILLVYLRLFVPPKCHRGKTYIAIQITIWANLVLYVIDVFITIFQCVPREKAWIPSTPGNCLNLYALIISTAVFNVVSDVGILMIPICVVWNLQMPMYRHLGLTAIFAVGLLAVTCSVVRLILSVQGARDPNQTVVLIQISLWAIAELTSGIIVGCMPILPSFYHYLFTTPQTSSHTQNSYPSSSTSFSASRKSKSSRHWMYDTNTSIMQDTITSNPKIPESPLFRNKAYMELRDWPLVSSLTTMEHGFSFADIRAGSADWEAAKKAYLAGTSLPSPRNAVLVKKSVIIE
ncbi:hypothetical protein MMC25_003388 [Agyrium rufum]|nr:hypothetical protein [Agyrium rufum]